MPFHSFLPAYPSTIPIKIGHPESATAMAGGGRYIDNLAHQDVIRRHQPADSTTIPTAMPANTRGILLHQDGDNPKALIADLQTPARRAV
jgi:hypothetical protein